MTQPHDLHAWTQKAIQRREQIAFNALNHGRAGAWVANSGTVEIAPELAGPSGDVFEDTVVFNEGAPTVEQAEHIAANDPEAVLRRCAADRKLIALHQPVEDRYGWGSDDDDTEYGHISPACSECGAGDAAVRYPCPTVRAVAEGYGWTEDTP